MAISTEDALEFLDASNDPRADWMAGQLRGNAQELARTDLSDAGRQSLESHQSILLRDAEQMEAESAMSEMGLDPEFANPACDCAPGEPCCLISGEIADSEDGTRKVTWPVLNDTHPTRLYVIAKKVEGINLTGKVKSKLNPSKACVCGIKPHRGLIANNDIGDPNPLPISETEQSIPVPRAPNFQILGSEILPESFVIAMSAVDAVMTATQSFEEGNEVTYLPYMCLPEDGMGSDLKVKAIPQMKLEGKSEAEISVGFYTVGVTSAAGVTAGLTGKVGDRTIEVEAEAKAEVSAAAAAPVEEDNGESGMTGFIGNMIGKMAKFASKGTKASDGINTEGSSGVLFTFKLGLEATGLELKAVGGAPDLKLETGKFGVYLSLEAEGKIDVIEAISVALLSPAAARAVQKIRQAAAKGETVKGVAKAEIELSAEGELKQSYDSGFSYLLSANGQSRFERGESGATFDGKVTLSGTATVLIHAELETWIVSAEAGAGGSLHTAWVWEMEKQGGTRKKRSYFEGLRARVVAYAGLSIGSSDDPDEPEIGGGRDTTPGLTAESTGQASQEIASVGRQLDAEEFDPERDAWLIEPTVPNVTSTSPPWENY